MSHEIDGNNHLFVHLLNNEYEVSMNYPMVIKDLDLNNYFLFLKNFFFFFKLNSTNPLQFYLQTLMMFL
jgi:hypothetical protein